MLSLYLCCCVIDKNTLGQEGVLFSIQTTKWNWNNGFLVMAEIIPVPLARLLARLLARSLTHRLLSLCVDVECFCFILSDTLPFPFYTKHYNNAVSCTLARLVAAVL